MYFINNFLAIGYKINYILYYYTIYYDFYIQTRKEYFDKIYYKYNNISIYNLFTF